jgi:hypothetical protein
MKKLAKTVLGVALLSGVVLAQPVKPVTKHGAKAQERFEHVKARILHMINREMGFLQNRKACVEKAQNWKELRACRPHKYATVHKKMWHKHMWHKHMKKMEQK